MSPSHARVLDLTEAMLAAARTPHPDLALLQELLQTRGALLAGLDAPAPGERAERLATLLHIQAVDAELRSRLAERHANVRDQLVLLARRQHQPRTRRSGGQYLDRKV